VEITKKERDRLIRKISKASGVAQYALQEKMTNEQVIKAAENLEVLALLKKANDFNRYTQRLKTQEANDKLKAFLDVQNSEILSAGKWLINALSKSGSDRKQTLLEKDLVHKEEYNDAVTEMGGSITEITNSSAKALTEAQAKIAYLEKRVDTLKSQLSKIQDYISFNYGRDKWQAIKKTFNLD
jgi:hypothetical protein